MKRPELVLAAAVAVSLPMAPGIVDGALAPTTAAVRFLIALVLCWVGGSALGTVAGRYSDEARRAEAIRIIVQGRQANQTDPEATRRDAALRGPERGSQPS